MAIPHYKQYIKVVSGILAVLFVMALTLWIVVKWHHNSASYIYKTTQNSIPEVKLLLPQFTDITLTSGIQHSHTQHSGKISDLIDSLSAGVCAADFNQDNWVDLLFISGAGQTRFYGDKAWWHQQQSAVIYQNQQGYFKLQKADLALTQVSHACAVADFNLDGLPDILIATQAHDILYQNLGNFKFAKVEQFSALTLPVWTSHISVADINHDGLPDIHLSHFLKYQKNQKNLEESAGFSEQHHREFQPQAYDGLPNQVLINQGNWQFKDISPQMGMHQISERTVAARWLDLNQDGWLDLLEFNSGDQAIRGFINRQGKFNPVSTRHQSLTANDSRYASVSLQLNDPHPLLFVSRESGLSNLAIDLANDLAIDLAQPSFAATASSHQPYADLSWRLQLNHQESIYLSRWGQSFADFTNDGYAELILASGRFMPDPFSQQMGLGAPNECFAPYVTQQVGYTVRYRRQNCLPDSLDSSRSVIHLDINNDGLLDLLVSNNNDFPRLFLNTSSSQSNWLNLTVPAHLNVSSLNIENRKNVQPLAMQQAMFGQHDPRLHFGLGTRQKVQLEVIQAGKAYQQTLQANRFYQWKNEHWIEIEAPANASNTSTRQQHPAGAFGSNEFNDLTDYLRRQQNKIIDYQLLPHLTLATQFASSKELTQFITEKANINHLALYLYWLESTEGELQQASASAIQQLEAEISTAYLLPLLNSENSETFCKTSQIFTHWFSQEEAVTRSKYKALPYLFRRLHALEGETKNTISTIDTQNNKTAHIINCTAAALAEAEHANASSAIVEAFAKAPAASRAHLINALGKIRQTEAIPLLQKRLKQSDDITEIQQALIALKRLNADIATQQMPGKTSIFLALALFNQAPESIVIAPAQIKSWLTQLNFSYADMKGAEQQSLYLTAALSHSLSLPELLPLLQDSSIEVKKAASRLILAQPALTLQYKKGLSESDLSKKTSPAQLQTLLDILPLELNQNELQLLAKNWRQTLQKVPVSHLNDRALANLAALFVVLTDKQQIQLDKQLQKQALRLSKVQTRHLYDSCLQNTSNTKQREKAMLRSPQSSLELKLCSILSFSHLPASTINQQIKSVLDSLQPGQQETLLGLLNLPDSLRQSLPFQRLSAAILASQIAPKYKMRWAFSLFKTDKFSANWLLQEIGAGNDIVLKQLMLSGDYKWLAEQKNIDEIIKNKAFAANTREKLKSYWLQEQLR
ncbi:CRTAC1 family protein [Catenovulum sediminis]|uniref:CRTAC1 family protein n=1 Tax=Catenovulum sediminis TaxID=1740262 RepID=A0ABV1RFB5_9ALTE